jgi:hypothetical protein
MLNRIFSTDSAKAIKAGEFGYLNAIQYLAPHDLSGVNLCPHASTGCVALCLGWMSGQAGMVSDLERDTNSVRDSRIAKAKRFMSDRAGYVADIVKAIEAEMRAAKRMNKKLCVRLNGSSDIAWEGVACRRSTKGGLGDVYRNIFEAFPEVEFVDYTKNPRRFDRALPANYHLTFSRSETNEAKAIELLARGVNVAVVFAGDKPRVWNGFDVIDGDEHDLRQLDPRGARGFVIALTPKGRRAKKDQSGFVVRVGEAA